MMMAMVITYNGAGDALYFDSEVGQLVAVQPGQPEKLLCGARGVEHFCQRESGESFHIFQLLFPIFESNPI